MVKKRLHQAGFDVERFLQSPGISRKVITYQPSQLIFSQGEPCASVLYVQTGTVKLSVLARSGKEAIVGMFGPGDFFGEGCLAGQPVRFATATALEHSRILVLSKRTITGLLHAEPEFSDRFLAHMLARNIRIEEDLVDHLFNSSEKRLARALLLLARYGSQNGKPRVLPKLSQEVLAEMVGTTRSRVNVFMNKFRKLGFIEYNGGLKINNSLMSVVLHD